MKTPTHSAFSRTARIAAGSLLAVSALGSAATGALAANGGSGSIWTTTASCSAPAPQNANLYAPGDAVYLRGSRFVAETAFGWTIDGLPGGASGDPGLTVATGNGTTDANGAFCVRGVRRRGRRLGRLHGNRDAGLDFQDRQLPR